MAASVASLFFSNRRRLSVYLASSAAVGVRHPVDISAAAGTGSPTDFRVPEVMTATDFITTATAGEFEVVADGVPTGRFIATDASQAASAIRTPINITFRPGVKYELIQRVAASA